MVSCAEWLSKYENLYKRINKEYGFTYSFDQSIDEQNENVNAQIRADNDNAITSKAANSKNHLQLKYYF